MEKAFFYQQGSIRRQQSPIRGQSPVGRQDRIVKKMTQIDPIRVPLPLHGLKCGTNEGSNAVQMKRKAALLLGRLWKRSWASGTSKTTPKPNKNIEKRQTHCFSLYVAAPLKACVGCTGLDGY